jgi:ribosomal protein S5
MELTEEKSSTFVSSERKEKFSGRNSRRKTPVRLSKLKYEEKIVQVKRVTKVTTGGKKNDLPCNCYYWR